MINYDLPSFIRSLDPLTLEPMKKSFFSRRKVLLIAAPVGLVIFIFLFISQLIPTNLNTSKASELPLRKLKLSPTRAPKKLVTAQKKITQVTPSLSTFSNIKEQAKAPEEVKKETQTTVNNQNSQSSSTTNYISVLTPTPSRNSLIAIPTITIPQIFPTPTQASAGSQNPSPTSAPAIIETTTQNLLNTVGGIVGGLLP